MWILDILLCNLCIVLIIEIPLGIVMGARSSKSIATVALINIITNPAVVFSSLCFAIFFAKSKYIGLFVLELTAFFVEGVAFCKFKTFGEKNPYVVSFVLNIASYMVGELIEILL